MVFRVTRRYRLEDANQTTLIFIEPDHVSIQTLFHEGPEEATNDVDNSCNCAHFDEDEFERYSDKIISARIAMANARTDLVNQSWMAYCRTLTEGWLTEVHDEERDGNEV